MSEKHDEIIKTIKKAIITKIKTDKVYIEFSYRFHNSQSFYYIDLLVQIKGIIYIFECKTNKNQQRAKKQLNFHESSILNLSNILSLSNKLLPFSVIKKYFVSTEMNIITNINTNETVALDPTFLENPLEFLNR